MLIIPAIDIMDGKVVRLHRGDFQNPIVYDLSPFEFACKWRDEGAQLIHIVDLDGARDGEPKNFEAIKDIIAKVGVKFEVGGGIRSLGSIKAYFEAGAERVVLSTKLMEDESFLLKPEVSKFIDKMVVSLDIKQMESTELITGATGGWDEAKDVLIDIPSFIKTVSSRGIKYLNFSDISKDGMLLGPDSKKILYFLKTARSVVRSGFIFTYAGGIASLEDIRMLNILGEDGVNAVIVGRALYENKFSLKEAIQALG